MASSVQASSSVQISWLGAAISLFILCFVVVLMISTWWRSKAGSEESAEEGDELAVKVKQLETVRDFDGVAALLLSAWTTKSSSRAVALAHELSRRYPAEVFQMGCPLQQGNRVLDPAPSEQGQEERDGGGSDRETPSPTTPATNAAVTSPWERGWKGPEGFKPPPSSSSFNSSSTAADPTPSRDFGSTSLSSRKREAEEGDSGDEGEAVTRRNFTIFQLNSFDGGVPAPVVRGGEIKAREARPIYIALSGDVYDASAGRHLYGPGGEYSEFAGHDISRRVAKGIKDAASTSTGSVPLDDLSVEGLDRFEKMTLRGWEDTFKARGYPRVGRLVVPPPPRLFSRAELRGFDGRSAVRAASEGAGRGAGGGGAEGNGEGKGGAGVEGEAASVPMPVPVPAGAAQPIYMGVRDKVFDVSFGGSEFYVEGGPYECLAGRDASRVLAKMSMKPEDIEGVLDYASLNDREEKNLADWVEKLGEGGRGYPVVGWIDLGVENERVGGE